MFSRFPVAFRRTGIRFLGHPVPAEVIRFPHGQRTRRRCRRPDLNGVAVFRTSQTRPGWVPPIPRDRRCSLAGVGSTDQRLPHPSGRSCTLLEHPTCRAHDYEASSGVHSRSPVRSSPSPVASGWNGRPWA